VLGGIYAAAGMFAVFHPGIRSFGVRPAAFAG
jgi:hypothetical protein